MHLMIIPDGDRRYATKYGLTLNQAYEKAAVTAYNLLKWSLIDNDINEFTFFGLSYNNVIKRKNKELSPILKAQTNAINSLAEDDLVHDNKIKVVICGQKHLLPKEYLEAVSHIEATTANYKKKKFNLLLGYSGQIDLEQAIQKTLDQEKKPLLENILPNCQVTNPIDFIVRTANEIRISDGPFFLTKYSEFHTIPTLFPALEKKDLDDALQVYKDRNRTFGV